VIKNELEKIRKETMGLEFKYHPSTWERKKKTSVSIFEIHTAVITKYLYCHLRYDDVLFGSYRRDAGSWFIRKVMNSYQITFLHILQGTYLLNHNGRSPRPDLKPGTSKYAGWIRCTRRRSSLKRKNRCSGNTKRRRHCSASSICITYVLSSSSEKRTAVKGKTPIGSA
jgi:hypothetical protein